MGTTGPFHAHLYSSGTRSPSTGSIKPLTKSRLDDSIHERECLSSDLFMFWFSAWESLGFRVAGFLLHVLAFCVGAYGWHRVHDDTPASMDGCFPFPLGCSLPWIVSTHFVGVPSSLFLTADAFLSIRFVLLYSLGTRWIHWWDFHDIISPDEDAHCIVFPGVIQISYNPCSDLRIWRLPRTFLASYSTRHMPVEL